MKTQHLARAILIATAVCSMAVSASSSPATRKTRVTFNESVRVPGALLPAGTYFFETPQRNNRTIVRISKEDGSFVTQFMGITDFTRQREHDIVVFGDHECGPKAVKAWFYPASGQGVRFVYPEAEAEAIAASCDEPVPEIHEKTVSLPEVTTDKVYLITPKKQEEEYTPEALSHSDEVDNNGFHSTPAAATEKGTATPQ